MLTASSRCIGQRQKQAQMACSLRSCPALVHFVQPHRIASQRLSVVSAAGKVQKINAEELEVAIAGRTTPIIVDFFANWCGPCLILSQELEKVAEQLGEQVKIVKIDVDENPDLASMLKIEGLPTVVFIPKDAGKPSLRTEGLLPADRIVQIFKESM